jgi:hypothetical protein
LTYLLFSDRVNRSGGIWSIPIYDGSKDFKLLRTARRRYLCVFQMCAYVCVSVCKIKELSWASGVASMCYPGHYRSSIPDRVWSNQVLSWSSSL